MSTNILWRPNEILLKESALAKFIISLGFNVHNYEEFHNWSIHNKADFWRAVWNFTGVIGEIGKIIYKPNTVAKMTGAQFFPKQD